MLFKKTITTKIHVDKPIAFAVSANERALQILREQWINRCYQKFYIVNVLEVKNVTMEHIDIDAINSCNVSLDAVVECVYIVPGEIVNIRIIQKLTGISNGTASILRDGNEVNIGFATVTANEKMEPKVGHVIPCIVLAAQHGHGQHGIFINSTPYLPGIESEDYEVSNDVEDDGIIADMTYEECTKVLVDKSLSSAADKNISMKMFKWFPAEPAKKITNVKNADMIPPKFATMLHAITTANIRAIKSYVEKFKKNGDYKYIINAITK